MVQKQKLYNIDRSDTSDKSDNSECIERSDISESNDSSASSESNIWPMYGLDDKCLRLQ